MYVFLQTHPQFLCCKHNALPIDLQEHLYISLFACNPPRPRTYVLRSPLPKIFPSDSIHQKLPHVLLTNAVLPSYWVAACFPSPSHSQTVSIWCHIYATPDAPTWVFALAFVWFRHLGSAGGGLQHWLWANMVADGWAAVGLRVLKLSLSLTWPRPNRLWLGSPFSVCTYSCYGNHETSHGKEDFSMITKMIRFWEVVEVGESGFYIIQYIRYRINYKAWVIFYILY